jgi:hypothetical protein
LDDVHVYSGRMLSGCQSVAIIPAFDLMSETVPLFASEFFRATIRRVRRSRDGRQAPLPTDRCDHERPGADVPVAARLPRIAWYCDRTHLPPFAEDPGLSARTYRRIRSYYRWNSYGSIPQRPTIRKGSNASGGAPDEKKPDRRDEPPDRGLSQNASGGECVA